MGDLDFVREVYAASYSRLVGQLTGVTGDPVEAEDVVMDAFAKASRDPRAFARLDNPEAWLRTVAVNAARSRFRRFVRGRGWSPRCRSPRRTTTCRRTTSPCSRRSAACPSASGRPSRCTTWPTCPWPRSLTLGVAVGTVKARLSRGRAALAVLLTDSPTDFPADLEDRHA